MLLPEQAGTILDSGRKTHQFVPFFFVSATFFLCRIPFLFPGRYILPLQLFQLFQQLFLLLLLLRQPPDILCPAQIFFRWPGKAFQS